MGCAGKWIGEVVGRMAAQLHRWGLWLRIRWRGRQRLPSGHRRWLNHAERGWRRRVEGEYAPGRWEVLHLRGALIQPMLDLLNRPSGGEAYYGGVVCAAPEQQPVLRHFRGDAAVDRPCLEASAPTGLAQPHGGRLFWCGPLGWHFGHQVADFGSRVLLASVDPRGGTLLWAPWPSGNGWDALAPWQRALLAYLNPGQKPVALLTQTLKAEHLIVVPQQARMWATPSVAHLEALGWCEDHLAPGKGGVLYVSRTQAAPCLDGSSLRGSIAAERQLESLLRERGVGIVYPEQLSLGEQLAAYRGANAIVVAEGSAQHGLELLGVHVDKEVIVICRRPQRAGMELPLRARFPRVRWIEAIAERWMARGGAAWCGLTLVHWERVAAVLNTVLDDPLSGADMATLQQASQQQLQRLAATVPLQLVL